MYLPLDSIWNLYNGRADCENRIKELKQDFGLDNFCMKDFWATEASFRFIMAAYNILSLFRFFALQSHRRSTLRTLKLYCFALGAWTTNRANRKVLKFHCRLNEGSGWTVFSLKSNPVKYLLKFLLHNLG